MPSNKFKLGLKLWSNGTGTLSDAVKLYQEGLYSYIELYVVPGSFDKLILSYKALSIPFILHCPHESHNFDLSDKNKEKENIEVFKEVVKYAEVLKAKNIVIHSGSKGSIEEASRQIKLLKDPRILVENTVHIGSTIEDIKFLLMNNKIKFCLDVSHAICTANNRGFDPIVYLNEFKKLNPSLYHLTGGTFESKNDQHNHFSESNYPWGKILPILTIGSRITIETDRRCPDSLSDFREDVKDLNKIINKEIITLRKAKDEDLIFLYNLRNEESVRSASFNTEEIDIKTHKAWFKRKLKDKDSLILIGEINKEKIGQIRFDLDNDGTEVSLAISSQQRGKGYGLQLLTKGCQYAFEKLKINTIISFIKPENEASLKIFLMENFINLGLSYVKSQKCIKMVLKKNSK